MQRAVTERIHCIMNKSIIQFTDAIAVTLSGKKSIHQLIRRCKAKLFGQDSGYSYENMDVDKALEESDIRVMRRLSFSESG